MNIDPKNEIIMVKVLSIYREVYKFSLPAYDLTFDDHNDCRYRLSYLLNSEEFVFSFYCKNFDQVFSIDGPNFLKEKYPGSYAFNTSENNHA